MRHCADVENNVPCSCTDEEKSLVGTWCTPEIHLPSEKGYEIVKIYEVYHFTDSSKYDKSSGNGGLFAGYVKMFLKIKQEA